MTAQIETPEMKEKRGPSREKELRFKDETISRKTKTKEPSEIVLELFKEEMPYKVECNNCKSSFFRKTFEKSLKELLETEPDLLYQLDRPSELTYWICPNCENPVDFSKRGTYQ